MIVARYGNQPDQQIISRMPESTIDPATFLKNQPPWYHVALSMARDRFLYPVMLKSLEANDGPG